MQMILIRITRKGTLRTSYLQRGFIMSTQASTTRKPSGTTLATGAKAKPLTKAQLEHKAQIEQGATLIAEAAWSKGSGEYNLSEYIRRALSLPAVDGLEILNGAFAQLHEKSKATPIDVKEGQKPTEKQRAAYEAEVDAKAEQWFKSGNSTATLCRQLCAKMDLDAKPIVSVKLDRSKCEARVTYIPAGATREEVAAALSHDAKALTQVNKVLDKDDALRAEKNAEALGLPSPKAEKEAREKAEKEAQEKADLVKGIVKTTSGVPLSEIPMGHIAACLVMWPSKDLLELAGMLTAQAGRNAKAEARQAERDQKAADAEAAKKLAAESGKGTGANAKAGKAGKAGKSAPVKPATPASAGNAKRADKPADGVTKNTDKATGADNLTDNGVTITPTLPTPDANASA